MTTKEARRILGKLNSEHLNFQEDPELCAIDLLTGGELGRVYFARQSLCAQIAELAPVVSRIIEDFKTYTNIFERMKEDLARDREYREAVLSSKSRDCFLLLMSPEAHSLVVNTLQARLEVEGIVNKSYQIVRDTLLDSQKRYQRALQELKTEVSV